MQLPELSVLEKGIVHGVLMDNSLLESPDVLSLRGEHFASLGFSFVWDAIRQVFEQHKGVDYPLLLPFLSRPNWPRHVTMQTLIELDQYRLAPQVFRAAVREVQKQFVVRQLRLQLSEALQDLQRAADPAALMTGLQESFENLRVVQSPSESILIGEAVQGSVERLSQKIHMNGVSTGFKCLDDMHWYFQNGTLTVVAGRPGMGKSTAFTQFCQNAALKGRTPLLFSFEDGLEDVADRSLIRMSQVPRAHFQAGLREFNQRKVDQAISRLTPLPYHLNDRDRQIDQLIAQCHRMVKQHGVDVIFIDQLSHLSVSRMPPGVENRNHLYGWFCSQLIHEVAKPLNVPVVVASQLKRIDPYTDKESGLKMARTPDLSDLRDSGELENYAYRALGIHRPEYYDELNRPSEADFLVLKNRNGPTGTVTVAADMSLYTFSEMGA